MVALTAEDIASALDNKTIYRQALSQFINRLNFKDGSEVGGHVDNQLISLLRDRDDVAQAKPSTIVSVNVSTEQKTKLEQYFPELRIKFTDSSFSDHPFANAMRMCINSLFYQQTRGEKVVDVGGSLSYHVAAGHKNVHVCNPVLSAKDVLRREVETSNLRKMSADVKKHVDTDYVEALKTCTCCLTTMKDCDCRCDVGMSVDVYDMSLQYVVDCMEKRGINRFLFAALLPVELLESEGQVVLMDTDTIVKWKTNAFTANKVNYFINGVGEMFTHNLDNLRGFLKTARVVSSSAACYHVILDSIRGDYKLYSIVKADYSLPVSTTVRRYPTSLSRKYKVVIPANIRNSYDLKELYFDEDFVSRVKGYLVNTADSCSSRNFEYAMTTLRSQKTHLIVGSRVIHSKIELDPNELPTVVATFLRDAVRSRADAMLTAALSSHEDWGAFKWIWHAVCKLFEFNKRVVRVIVLWFIKLLNRKYYKFLMGISAPIEKVESFVDVNLTGVSNFWSTGWEKVDHAGQFEQVLSESRKEATEGQRTELMKLLTKAIESKVKPEDILKDIVSLPDSFGTLTDLWTEISKKERAPSGKVIIKDAVENMRKDPKVLDKEIEHTMTKEGFSLEDVKVMNSFLNATDGEKLIDFEGVPKTGHDGTSAASTGASGSGVKDKGKEVVTVGKLERIENVAAPEVEAKDDSMKDFLSSLKDIEEKHGLGTGSATTVQSVVVCNPGLPDAKPITRQKVSTKDESDSSDSDCASMSTEAVDDSIDGVFVGDIDKVEECAVEKLIDYTPGESSYDMFKKCIVTGCDWVTSKYPHLSIRRASRCNARSLPVELEGKAVVEYMLHLGTQCYDLFAKYLKLNGQIGRISRSGKVSDETMNSFKDLNVFRRNADAVYIEGERVDPNCAFMVFDIKEERFVTIEDFRNGGEADKWFAVCSDAFKGICFRLLAAAVKVARAGDVDSMFSKLMITLENTPPGGGKTTRLVEEYLKLPHQTLVVTANSGSAEDINAAISKKTKKPKRRVARTADSRLMNWVGVHEMAVCRIDECFLLHLGQLKLVSVISKAKSVVLYGDENQIPFINRIAAFRCKEELLKTNLIDTKHIDGSYRCPGDVCWYLSQLKNDKGSMCYPKGVRKMHDGRPTRSVSASKILSEDDVPTEGYDVYLVYTQKEKGRLEKTFKQKRTKAKVMSVHESQGKTFKNVAVVRTKDTDDIVFDSLGHHIVAVSRHTNELKYFVVSKKFNDRLGKAVGAMQSVKDELFRGVEHSNNKYVYTPLPARTVVMPSAGAKVGRSHLNVINEFLEETVNGSTSLDFYHREDCIEFEDFECSVDNVVIKENSKKRWSPRKEDMIPVVRSQIGSKKRDTLRSNIVTYEARNQNADRGADLSTSEIISDEIVDRFFSKCIDSRKLAEVVEDEISISKPVISEWLDSRASQGYKSLLKDLEKGGDYQEDLTKFSVMVKSDAKPKLDDSIITKVSTGQNIVYHRRKINALYSNIFIQVLNRLKYVVASNIVLYNGMNTEEFAKEVQSRVGTDIDSYFCGELDISKYDKSQGALFKQVEEKVLRRLGVASDVLDTWYASEYASSVTTAQHDFNVDIGAQRRSGASNTWLGNTIINMCLQSYCTNFDSIPCCCFAGDDSLLLSVEPLEDTYTELSTLFGFDVKFINKTVPYFCSKYVVSDGFNLRFVPDPYKVLVKLARILPAHEDKCHEIFVSFCDSVKYLNHENIIDKLRYYHSVKYNCRYSTYSAFASIHCLSANFSQFRRLFISKTPKAFGISLS